MLQWASSQVEQLDHIAAAKAPRKDDLPSVDDADFEGRAFNSSASARGLEKPGDDEEEDYDPEADLPESFVRAEQSEWAQPELKDEFVAALSQLREQRALLAERHRRVRTLRGSVSRSAAVHAQELVNLRQEVLRVEAALGSEKHAHAATRSAGQGRDEALVSEAAGYRKALEETRQQAAQKAAQIASMEEQAAALEAKIPELEREIQELDEKLREEGMNAAAAAEARGAQAPAADGGAGAGGGGGADLAALERDVEERRVELARVEREAEEQERAAARAPSPAEREDDLRRRLGALEEQFASKQAHAGALERDREDLARRVSEATTARRARAQQTDRAKRNKIGRVTLGDVELGRAGGGHVRQRGSVGGGGGGGGDVPGAGAWGKPRGGGAGGGGGGEESGWNVARALLTLDNLSLLAGQLFYRVSWLRPLALLYIAGVHLLVFLVLSIRSFFG